METEKKMKLFVAGEISPHPDDWRNPDHILILASSDEEALAMIDRSNVVEVSLDYPATF
jgi:hypothetical protein